MGAGAGVSFIVRVKAAVDGSEGEGRAGPPHLPPRKHSCRPPLVLPPCGGTEPGSESLAGGRGAALASASRSDPWLVPFQVGPRSAAICLGHPTASPKLAAPLLQVWFDPPNACSSIRCVGKKVRPKVKYSSRCQLEMRLCSRPAKLW